MKVLGIAEKGTYIVEIKHAELEQYLDLYYGKLKELKIGEELDISDGYRYYYKTKDALAKTQEFFRTNVDNIKAITNAMLLCSKETNERNG